MLQNLKAIESFRNADAMAIEWNIGKLCNYNCVYCNPTLHDNSSPHLEYDDMKKVILFLMDYVDRDKILLCFTGGEPTLNPMLYNFCEYLSSCNIDNVTITTNGVQPASYYINISKYVNSMTFSQHFEKDRPIDKFLTKIKEINEQCDSFIAVQVMCHSMLFDDVVASVNFYKEHNITYSLRRIRPIKTRTGIYDAESLIVSTYDDAYEEWMINETKSQTKYLNTRVWYEENNSICQKNIHVNEITTNKLHNFNGWTCWAGVNNIRIGPTGEMYRCAGEVGGSIGNIITGLEDITFTPIVCPLNKCTCSQDISVSKAENENYFNLINK